MVACLVVRKGLVDGEYRSSFILMTILQQSTARLKGSPAQGKQAIRGNISLCKS